MEKAMCSVSLLETSRVSGRLSTSGREEGIVARVGGGAVVGCSGLSRRRGDA